MKSIKEYLEIIDDVISKGKFKDNWDSLSEWTMPDWYKKGRFGLFIHWGVYSVPACETEWYPRMMYIKGTKSYNHRIKNYGANCDYKDLIEKFNPVKFDAEEWLKLFAESGAKYIMPVGEHHDGIKMYKSELNKWNMADLPQGRDYIEELHKACDKYGIGFMCSSHRAEHYWFMNGARKFCPDSEINKGINQDLYGPAMLSPSGNLYDLNNLKGEKSKQIIPTEEWLQDWLASSAEMIDRNHPLAVYFDWWIFRPEFKLYIKKFLAYYYNRALEWGKEVGVFYKVGAVMKGCAIFDVERGQIDNIATELWQNDTAIAKNSWGYTEGNQFKTPYEILTNMIDVVSKNGCFMLNVGPKADGTVCDEEKYVLKEIGKWLKVNGEAIYDCEPYVVYGEGKKHKNGSFKENLKYSKTDYRFTYKTNAIYVFPMAKEFKNVHKIKSLKYADDGIRYNIADIKILGYDNKVTFNHTPNGLDINIEGQINTSMPICIKVCID